MFSCHANYTPASHITRRGVIFKYPMGYPRFTPLIVKAPRNSRRRSVETEVQRRSRPRVATVRGVLRLIPPAHAGSTTSRRKSSTSRLNSSGEIVSRDRSALYADGITRGAPAARQVADRWHLLRSLREALERLLDGKAAARQAAVAPTAAPLPTVPGGAPSEAAEADATPSAGPTLPTAAGRETQRRRARRLARFEEVRTLAAGGLNRAAIAAQPGMSRRTVRRYVRAEAFPERAPRSGDRGHLDPYTPYLRQRWADGCRNGLQRYREVHERGYPYSRGAVARYVARLRRATLVATPTGPDAPCPAPAPAPRATPSARRVARWFLRRPERQTPAQEAYLARLGAADPDLAEAYALGQEFAAMLRDLQGARLATWLTAAERATARELRAFATGLRADEAAVQAGLTEPWSTGPVEGQITRLKLLKRQGYGRAGFALLRQRVLRPTG
jgi:transposase